MAGERNSVERAARWCWTLLRERPLNVVVPGLTERWGIDARRQARRLAGQSAVVVGFRYPPPYAAGPSASPRWRRLDVELDGQPLTFVTAHRHRCAHRLVDPGTHTLRVTGNGTTSLSLRFDIDVPSEQCVVVSLYPGDGVRSEEMPGRLEAVAYKQGRRQPLSEVSLLLDDQ